MLSGRGSRGGRDGLTLVEVIVAVAITAIIGASVYTTLGGSRDRERVRQSYEILRDITRIIDRFDTATQGGTLTAGRHPRSLFQLNNPITTTQTTNCTGCRNVCNVAYVSGNVSGWNSNGPLFQSRDVTVRTGFRIPIGLVRDSLVRVPAAAPADQGRTFGLLQITIDTVTYDDARDLKSIVDGTADSSLGVVRWSTNAVNGVLASIFWTLPLAGC